MKKNLIFLIMSFLFLGSIHAQENHFTPDGITGTAKAIFWCEVHIDGVAQTSSDIEVAMFFNGACRNTTRIQSYYSGNFYGALLDGQYENAGLTVTFKCYDHVTGTEYPECPYTYTTTGETETVSNASNPTILEFTTPTPAFTKDILAYTGNNNYYLIASPIGAVASADVDQLLTNDFDFYYFDQSQNLFEWQNYETTPFNFAPGVGYLYANSNNVTLTFTGNAYEGDSVVTLVKDDNANLAGWNLVGNPFAHTTYLEKTFYTMNESRNNIIVSDGNSVEAMEGVFVIATENNETITFSTTPPNKVKSQVVVNLSSTRGTVMDRAIVDFSSEPSLPKFMLNDDNTNIAFDQEDKDFALVHSDGHGELPVNFMATEEGSYTLSVNPKNIEMAYLHLIDNLTGADIDLLQTPSYTFTANSTKSSTRFKLKFDTKAPAYPWTVNPNAYQGNGYITALVQVNGETITDGSNWEVGAFNGDQCLGLGNTTNGAWVEGNSYTAYPYYLMMTLYGNGNEVLNFYLYDKANSTVHPGVCDVTVTYTNNCEFGDLNDPYILNFVTDQNYTLDINAYTEKGGFYLISTPIGSVDPTEVDNMLANDYDLYYFDQNYNELEWRNYEENSFNLEPGKGYLYANSSDGINAITTLTFTGKAYEGEGVVTLAKNDESNLAGWNLVGNPYAETAYITKAFYTMNGEGSEIVAGEGNSVAAMQGIFVIAETNDEEMSFSLTEPNKSKQIVVNVNKNRSLVDRAIIRMDEQQRLPKFMLNENHTNISFVRQGNDYAVISSSDEDVLPVNFKAAEEGTYTLAIALEEVELQYLTLVDKLNNMEVDLLSTPAYTFTATPSDMVNRFTLRFKANTNVSENETVNPIAYRHDGLLNISGIEGESELQIIDMLGRVISSAIINGNYTTMIDNTPGTYVVRLINGKDTYTQKIVVE